MKKAAIYTFLFLYVSVQLRPLHSILSDVIAHTFFKVQHMATIHYENGAYHLHAELKKTAEDESHTSGKLPSSEKQDETVSCHILPETDYPISTNATIHFMKVHNQGKPAPVFFNIISPPPKV